jgi:hypothetical protein
MYKQILSGMAIALTFAIFIPYIRSIRRGQIRPHVFTWVIWALGTFVVFLAQLADGGGLGAWPIGVSGVITACVAVLALTRNSDRAIVRTDWAFLALALMALASWFFTSNPLWAVVILTAMDLAGFGPTFRSAYMRPYDEPIGFYAWGVLRNVLVILALENYSLTTVLFPAAVGIACIAFVAMVAYRRSLVTSASGVGEERI